MTSWLLWLPFDDTYRKIKYIIYSIAQCSMITNTVSFLKYILHDCPAKIWEFSARNVRMSESTFCHVDVHIRLLNDWAS